MTWQVDTSHTHINFTARHMMIAKVRGEFMKYDIHVDFDQETPANTTVDVSIHAASINTRDPQRDAHLRSPDFLNADAYPMLIFKSTRVEQIGPNHGRLIGDLTIRDVTREVVLDVDYAGLAKSPWGKTSVGFSASTTINRKDWDLTWNQAPETGGWLVGDQINIEIEMELIQVPKEVAQTA
jgi:polyisoprenoid-binding protein YceI